MLRWAGGTRARADARGKRRPVQQPGLALDQTAVVGSGDRHGLFGQQGGGLGGGPHRPLGKENTPASAAGYGTKAGKRRRRRGPDQEASLDAKALALPRGLELRCGGGEGAFGGPAAAKAAEQRLEALRSTARNRPQQRQGGSAAHRGGGGTRAVAPPQAVHSAPVSRLDDLLGDDQGAAAAPTAARNSDNKPSTGQLLEESPWALLPQQQQQQHQRDQGFFDFPGPVPPAAAWPLAVPLDVHAPAATIGGGDTHFFEDGELQHHDPPAAGPDSVLLPYLGFAAPEQQQQQGAGWAGPPFGGATAVDPLFFVHPAGPPPQQQQQQLFAPGTPCDPLLWQAAAAAPPPQQWRRQA